MEELAEDVADARQRRAVGERRPVETVQEGPDVGLHRQERSAEDGRDRGGVPPRDRVELGPVQRDVEPLHHEQVVDGAGVRHGIAGDVAQQGVEGVHAAREEGAARRPRPGPRGGFRRDVHRVQRGVRAGAPAAIELHDPRRGLEQGGRDAGLEDEAPPLPHRQEEGHRQEGIPVGDHVGTELGREANPVGGVDARAVETAGEHEAGRLVAQLDVAHDEGLVGARARRAGARHAPGTVRRRGRAARASRIGAGPPAAG
jgi:hypothetical protein